MKNNIFKKFSIFLKSRHFFKNWFLYAIVYFKWTKEDYVIFETKTGLKIKLRVNSTDLMALTNIWLKQEYSKPSFEIKTDDTIIDIGSHIGLFALYSAQFCKNGKIYCIEPIKENYDLLTSNIEINKLKNITSLNAAVSKTTSTVTIFLNPDEAGHSMFKKSSLPRTINAISLKQIFDSNRIEKCNLIKLDCEGAEYEILDSLPDEYFKKIQTIIAEYHFTDSKPEMLNNLKSKLTSLSFNVTTEPGVLGMGILYASKDDFN